MCLIWLPIFRSGAKKPPSPIQYDPTDPLHIEFISSAARLYAFMYGITPDIDDARAAEMSSSFQVPMFR
jgi:hypothetical protein